MIVTPAITVAEKTANAFAAVTPASYSPGHLTRKLEARIRSKGDVPPQFLFNAFDDVAREVFPGLGEVWRTFESVGAREVHVCGAGPSLFAPVSSREYGSAIQLMLQYQHGIPAHLVSLRRPDGAVSS